MMTDTPDDELETKPDGTLVGKINPDDYYMLEAQTSDWQWLLSNAIMKRNLNGDEAKPSAFVRMMPGDTHPVFFIRKDVLPPADLAKILGFKGAPEKLAGTDIIHLKPIGDQSQWQKPTVPYAGAA